MKEKRVHNEQKTKPLKYINKNDNQVFLKQTEFEVWKKNKSSIQIILNHSRKENQSTDTLLRTGMNCL